LAGIGGRLVAFNSGSGHIQWEAAVATPRGGNDVERLVDVVSPVSRMGSQVCMRAFQAAVGCVDAQRGTLAWRQNSDGQTGVSGDDSLLFGTDAVGRIQAWKRSNGEPVWTQEALKLRGLTAPLWLGKSVVVGDAQGMLHFVSREDGTLMARLQSDGLPLVGAPVLSGETLVAQTRSGNLFAWRPQ
jgi:outer membrane protein assembly factor BamB